MLSSARVLPADEFRDSVAWIQRAALAPADTRVGLLVKFNIANDALSAVVQSVAATVMRAMAPQALTSDVQPSHSSAVDYTRVFRGVRDELVWMGGRLVLMRSILHWKRLVRDGMLLRARTRLC
jgi:hypothetical protein